MYHYLDTGYRLGPVSRLAVAVLKFVHSLADFLRARDEESHDDYPYDGPWSHDPPPGGGGGSLRRPRTKPAVHISCTAGFSIYFYESSLCRNSIIGIPTTFSSPFSFVL
jgi:hypothetical protein